MTAKTTKRLTGKQQTFAELVAAGCSLSDAYRASYNTGAKPEVVAVEASRLAHDPRVALIVEQARARAMESATTTRTTLVARLEAVNKAAFDKLTADDAERVDYSALSAFLKTTDALMRHVPDDTFYGVAGAELTAQNNGDWTKAVFADDHVWFADGGKSLPAPDDWDSETVEPLPDGGVRITKKRIR